MIATVATIEIPVESVAIETAAAAAAAAKAVTALAGIAQRNSQDLWIGVSRDLLITS